MEILKGLNLAVRFIVEIGALVALGVWGFHVGKTSGQKYALGMITPLVAAGIWGLFVAPNAPNEVPGAVHVLLQVAIFGAAALSLFVTGFRRVALIFALVVAVNALLLYIWDQ